MHSACDYDPYEGWDVTGWPEVVLSRGEVVFERGTITARPGRGPVRAARAIRRALARGRGARAVPSGHDGPPPVRRGHRIRPGRRRGDGLGHRPPHAGRPPA